MGFYNKLNSEKPSLIYNEIGAGITFLVENINKSGNLEINSVVMVITAFELIQDCFYGVEALQLDEVDYFGEGILNFQKWEYIRNALWKRIDMIETQKEIYSKKEEAFLIYHHDYLEKYKYAFLENVSILIEWIDKNIKVSKKIIILGIW